MHGSDPNARAQRGFALRKFCLLVPLLVFWTPWAHGGTGQFSIQFKEHLGISNDLKLTGTRSSSSLRFAFESDWKPVPGSALHLFIAHSPDLDSGRSFVSVTLNYGVLRSYRLDEHNESVTELVIPLPPNMLRPDNEIVLSVEQSAREHASAGLWTIIKPSSFINLQYEESRATLDLRLLPSPLADPRSYRAKQISVLLPERASRHTLEATALIIANFAAELDEPLAIQTVRSIDAASDRLLIVGTAEEQPLRLLADQLPFGIFRVQQRILLGTKQQLLFDPDEGIVALTERPGTRFRPVLVVSGNTPAAVSRAARKLIWNGFEEAGTFARISDDVRLTPAAKRVWKGFVPPNSHFTLDQLEAEELAFDAQNDFSRSIRLLMTPDAQFLDYGHHITLRFRLSPDADIKNAQIDVHWNDSKLGSFQAIDFSSGSRTSIRVPVPARLLRPENVLDIRWRGLGSANGANATAWLLRSSEFDLPRDYESGLPDLGLLQHGFFPFAVQADLSDTTFVVPNEPNGELDGAALAALFELASRLGRMVRSNRFSFAVMRQAELKRETKISSHIIALRIGALPEAMPQKDAVAAVQESISPWDARKYLLSITAVSPASLQTAIKTVFSDTNLKRFRGDTAYVYPDRVLTFRAQPVRREHEYAYFAHLQTWLRENWIALPVILTSASCLLFVGLRLVLAQYKSRQ